MKMKTIALALAFVTVSPLVAEETMLVAEAQEQAPVVIATEEVSISATEQQETKQSPAPVQEAQAEETSVTEVAAE